MCKLKKYQKSNPRIDECMIRLIDLIRICTKYKPLACCCGHNKYPMTIVLQTTGGYIFELMSNAVIPRTRNFYKRDEQSYYYIPEVSKCQ